MTPSARTVALAAAAFAAFATTASARDLTIGLSAEASSIDPHFHQLSPNNQVRLNIFQSLVIQDEQQMTQPSLATQWKALSALS